MFKQILPALKATIVIAVMTGLVFPAIVTLAAQFLFPKQANGSLIFNAQGKIIGSSLIGQQFLMDKYFHPRPSAAGIGYAGEASAGTNLGPTSSKLILGQLDNPETKNTDESFAGIKQLSQQYRQDNLLTDNEKVPIDAVTRSASGLDPHISVNNAIFQARRIAKARLLANDQVLELIKTSVENRQFGIFGEPRVNVLILNLRLDNMQS